MTQKTTVLEQLACNNCFISLLMLDGALADTHGSTGVQQMIREFTQQFIGSHYNMEQIADCWDRIKELLSEIEIPEGTRAEVAVLCAEESIQTLLLTRRWVLW